MLAISPLILAAQRAIPDLPPRPGKGMAQHPFLYCGEWQRRSIADQTMYIANGNTLINNWVGSVPRGRSSALYGRALFPL
jgi:hypothetical protein